MYSVGDYVVKANNGVCRVEDIVHLDVSNVSKDKLYYLLIPQADRGAKLYVPVDTNSTSIRSVLSEESAWDIIEEIPDIEETWIANDKLREQEYKEALKSCDPRLLVGIIKNIYLRKKKRQAEGKKSTSIDDRYFNLAEQALYSELAFAIGREPEEINEIIQDKINKK
ncbi:MAG: CarD family transcriptional regulator [Lachnospiraceae bacterium]|nr:CarD family transcriptional regulator [Lachnospiraceae bacterium]